MTSIIFGFSILCHCNFSISLLYCN